MITLFQTVITTAKNMPDRDLFSRFGGLAVRDSAEFMVQKEAQGVVSLTAHANEGNSLWLT
ncbi:hypothetical protein [Yoonia sp.]|uniref:hypothetical protein n=1 Tax=Yoonia sp. TaxID=2212373 RepID=UPI00358ECC44